MVSNLVSGKIYGETHPTQNLKLGLSAQGYWREEEHKASGAGNGNFIGAELDLDLAYQLYQQLAYQIEAAYMFTSAETWGVEAGEENSIQAGVAAEDIAAADMWFLSHKLIYYF